MAYTTNTWVTGDTITADKLNHMEDGIASASGGPLIVNVTRISDGGYSNMALDKTWQEIHDALLSSGVTIVYHESVEDEEGVYDVVTPNSLDRMSYASEEAYPYLVTVADEDYMTTTANGYPRTYRELAMD